MIYKHLIPLFLFVLFSSLLIATSCDSESNEFIPDISEIELDNKLVRFDQLLANLDTNNLESQVDMLKASYPEFCNVYFKNVLPFEENNKTEFLNNLRGYLNDPRIQKLQDTVAEIFTDLDSKIIPQIDRHFKFMKYYFDDFQSPNIYTFTSEYTYQQFLFQDKTRDGIGIGLDMFLGADYDYKQIDPNNPAFSEYLTRTFSKQHISKKVIEMLINDRIGSPPGSRLLDHMIHNGKRLYVLEKVMVGVPDSIIFEYSKEQTEWVKENELEMWAFFFDQNLFYESNTMKINKYVNPSPNSPGMPEMAPGRTANYIGLQIIKAYMRKFPETSLNDLIALKDSQKIMDKSRYKPKRK